MFVSFPQGPLISDDDLLGFGFGGADFPSGACSRVAHARLGPKLCGGFSSPHVEQSRCPVSDVCATANFQLA